MYFLENNIGIVGAQALAESLIENTTLIQLNLDSMLEISVSSMC